MKHLKSFFMFEGLIPSVYETDEGWLTISELIPGMIGVLGVPSNDGIKYYKYEVVSVDLSTNMIQVISLQDSKQYEILYWVNLRVPETEKWRLSNSLTHINKRSGVFE